MISTCKKKNLIPFQLYFCVCIYLNLLFNLSKKIPKCEFQSSKTSMAANLSSNVNLFLNQILQLVYILFPLAWTSILIQYGNPLLFLLMAITFYESSMRDLPFLPKQCISQKSFPSLQLSKSWTSIFMPMHEYPRVLTFVKFQKPSSDESSFPI